MSGTHDCSTAPYWEPPSAEDLQRVLPQYQIQRLIARGGMGAVYEAIQRTLKRTVAIKVLPLDFSGGELDFAERFKREAEAMARLSHPNVVAVYDAGEAGDLLFFVMEYVEGKDLAEEIARRERLPPKEVQEIAMQICDALIYAHRAGVIHRDIKPANILIAADGVVKVADFGLAKWCDPVLTAAMTRTGTAVGTVDFMAPEARKPGTVVDGRADLYALGVTIYQMLVGELPHGMFKLPSQLVPEVADAFDDIICKALEPRPADRYTDAREMREALQDALGLKQTELNAYSPHGVTRGKVLRTPEASAPPPRDNRSRVRMGIAAGALTVAIAVLATWAGKTGFDVGPKPVVLSTPQEIRLWDTPEKLPKVQGVRWENGVLNLHDFLLQDHSVLRSDGALKASILMNPSAVSPKLCLRGSGKWPHESRYELAVIAEHHRIELEVTTPEGRKLLQGWSMPRAYSSNEWAELELRAVGQQLSASMDGKLLGVVRDETLAGPGKVQLYAKANGYFRNVTFRPFAGD